MYKALLSAIAFTLLLVACGPQRQGSPRAVIERALKTAPGKAQPSHIVAAEIAFARAARENGQWTAFREFMGPDAIVYGAEGPTNAARWLAGRKNPTQASSWAPRAVWISCDAKLAISRGRFRNPEGLVGAYVTIWQRQPDDKFRWVYRMEMPDDPQPDSTISDQSSDDLIVVTADDLIQGRVADCLEPGQVLSESPLSNEVDRAKGSITRQSPDGTVSWRWTNNPGGPGKFESYYFHEGQWVKVTEHILPHPSTSDYKTK